MDDYNFLSKKNIQNFKISQLSYQYERSTDHRSRDIVEKREFLSRASPFN